MIAANEHLKLTKTAAEGPRLLVENGSQPTAPAFGAEGKSLSGGAFYTQLIKVNVSHVLANQKVL